ncbi:MAG: hypothetical protein FD135_3608 [Comamonadaceae bacterium]|nr:MAG: hypothetical protein FD135_3608 [Comamonadaceae bacterium]
MELPAGLTPEIAAWMRIQMIIAAARAVEPLKVEINKVDDWANGLFSVFLSVLPGILRSNPELARQIAPQWKKAAEDFDRIHLYGKPARPDEPLEFLEARKMMYRIFGLLDIWKNAELQKPLQSVPKVRRA